MNIDNQLKKILGKRAINPIGSFGLKSFGGKKDLDFDGVPNRRDCQPRNTMRQDKISNNRYVYILKIKGRFKENWILNISTERPTIYNSKDAAEFAIKDDLNLQDSPRSDYKIIKIKIGEYAAKFGFDPYEDTILTINGYINVD